MIAVAEKVVVKISEHPADKGSNPCTSIGCYFRDVNRNGSTLSHEAICSHARIVRAGLDADLQLLGNKEVQLLKPAKVAKLKRLSRDGKRSQDAIVRANLKLVVSAANKFKQDGLHLSTNDLIQEGNFGLIEAARRFDPDKGFKFSTYAVHWIRQKILKAIHQNGRPVRVPDYMWAWISKRDRIIKEFERAGKAFTTEDVRLACGLTKLEYKRMNNSLVVVVPMPTVGSSINVFNDRHRVEPNQLPDAVSESPEEFAWVAFKKNALSESIERLRAYDAELAEAISLRFPIDETARQMTYKEIADECGKSASWATLACKQGLEWLRANTDASLFALEDGE